MSKLKSYIEQWKNGKMVSGVHVSLYDINCCIDIYNGIIREEKPEFINGKVKEILDKCDIKTVEHGIGWKIA